MAEYRWEKTERDPDTSSDGFCPVHPDRGAAEVPCISITHGLNADFSALPETAYIRCRKCGFMMNKARHPKGWGTGISFIVPQTWGNDWGNVDNVGYPQVAGEPVVGAGCPFCGSFIYD